MIALFLPTSAAMRVLVSCGNGKSVADLNEMAGSTAKHGDSVRRKLGTFLLLIYLRIVELHPIGVLVGQEMLRLIETPARVARALEEAFAGYDQDPAAVRGHSELRQEFSAWRPEHLMVGFPTFASGSAASGANVRSVDYQQYQFC